MQDFFGRGLRGQEAVSRPEPYQLYRRDQNLLPEAQSLIRDFEYFKSMYPLGARRLQQYVEEVCDEMEYEGSPIYDEYPDRILIEQMLQKISLKAAALQMQEPEERPALRKKHKSRSLDPGRIPHMCAYPTARFAENAKKSRRDIRPGKPPR